MRISSIDTDGTPYDGYGDGKLFKVNFTSLVKRGTIEFRQPGGTTDVTTINRLIRFCSVAGSLESLSPLVLAESANPLDTLFTCILQHHMFIDYYLRQMGGLPVQS